MVDWNVEKPQRPWHACYNQGRVRRNPTFEARVIPMWEGPRCWRKGVQWEWCWVEHGQRTRTSTGDGKGSLRQIQGRREKSRTETLQQKHWWISATRERQILTIREGTEMSVSLLWIVDQSLGWDKLGTFLGRVCVSDTLFKMTMSGLDHSRNNPCNVFFPHLLS